jgi:Uma2 family endonuclease
MGTPMASGPQRHRITVDDYYRMAEVGVLAPDARVELIEGEIIDMAPISPEHASVVDQLTRLLIKAADDSAIVRVQGSVRLSQLTEPEPDVAVLRPRPDFYRHAHPTGAEILLLVEVSDSTLRYDRDVKVPLYARYGVAEVWLVDLQHRCLLAYSGLAEGQYRSNTSTQRPGVTPLAALADIRIDLTKIFATD